MKIINLQNIFYTNYLIVTDQGGILIDCGNKMSYAKFLKKLEKAGINKEYIKHVILTHVHADHVSYLKDLMDDIHPTLYVGVGAKENLLRGEDNHVKYSSWFNKKMTSITLKLQHGPAKWNPIDISPYNVVTVGEDTYIDGFDAVVVPLPGHTLDGIGLAKKEGVFFTGDAIMSSVPARNLTPLLLESAEKFKESYNTLVQSGAKMFYTGHGNPVTLTKLQKTRYTIYKVQEF